MVIVKASVIVKDSVMVKDSVIVTLPYSQIPFGVRVPDPTILEIDTFWD